MNQRSSLITKLPYIDELDGYFLDVLDEMYREFSWQIMYDLTSFKYEPSKFSVFVDLHLVSREYALQKFFEPRLDKYIRDYLIDGVIEQVLEHRNIDVYRPSLSEDDNGPDVYYSTYDYEKNISDFSGFEFVIDDEIQTIGYRFTDVLDENKYVHFLEYGMMDQIIIVDWENTNGVSTEEQRKRNWGRYKDKIHIIGSREFFQTIFNEKESEAYEQYLRLVVREYQDTIGVSSLPKLTAPILFEHRIEEEKVLKEFAKEISLYCNKENSEKRSHQNEIEIGYRIVEQGNQQKAQYIDLEARSNSLIIKEQVISTYTEKKLYKALVGRQDFARSFLTSEYLYHQYNENDRFDYTAIVSGYLKSIEQLMYQIALFYVDKQDQSGKLYKIGARNKKITFTSSHVNADKIEATMGNLIYFYKDDCPEIVSLQGADRETLFDCLNLYLKECRNQSFHKHNNYDWERVKKIRSNTFNLYVLLLGSCKMSSNSEEIIRQLGIIKDDRLERIYYWLRKKNMYTFMVKFDSDNHPLKATRHAEDTFPYFDDFGLLQDFHITVDCGEGINSRKEVISRDNIPDELWYLSYVNTYRIDFSL